MSEVLPSAPPRQSAGYAPARVPGSARRTSSIDVDWPDGRNGNMRLVGRARDIVTPSSGGAPVLWAEGAFEAQAKSDRTIVSIGSNFTSAPLDQLVGHRGGGHLRQVLAQLMPEERRAMAPLYLILDDISGTSLVALGAWLQWGVDKQTIATMNAPNWGKSLNLEGVCTGLRTGSSAFEPGELGNVDNRVPVIDLRNPKDPDGWHAFTHQDSVGMRRARRIDVKLGDQVIIDAAFQDSATTPAGGRVGIHEYRLTAAADPDSFELLSIEAEPRVLPFVECPSAAANLSRLLGTKLPDLRETVPVELRRTLGCTHLNDALRSLAEVPVLVKHLRDQRRSET
jgi:hypothetical protein